MNRQVWKETKPGKLWTLFRAMFVLSACTFGGGFVIVSLMKKKFVEELGWMKQKCWILQPLLNPRQVRFR